MPSIARRGVRRLLKSLLPRLDAPLAPLTLLAAHYLRTLRHAGLDRLPTTRRVLQRARVLPIEHHYHEPLVYASDLHRPLNADRPLPGLDLNIDEQLTQLSCFSYQAELDAFPVLRRRPYEYYYRNGVFASGDSEYLYSIIRLLQPRRLIEIGSGLSTLMARAALDRNAQEGVVAEHVCIEPYEFDWLEGLGIQVIREPIEACKLAIFDQLAANDILFIDSSHVIRAQGDVLFEYLELLPRLRPGVYVHIHDIFTPRDYLAPWLLERQWLWNEQYLLEAFLSFNKAFRVVGALNYLWHAHRAAVCAAFPVIAREPWREPGSFWIVRNIEERGAQRV